MLLVAVLVVEQIVVVVVVGRDQELDQGKDLDLK